MDCPTMINVCIGYWIVDASNLKIETLFSSIFHCSFPLFISNSSLSLDSGEIVFVVDVFALEIFDGSTINHLNKLGKFQPVAFTFSILIFYLVCVGFVCFRYSINEIEEPRKKEKTKTTKIHSGRDKDGNIIHLDDNNCCCLVNYKIFNSRRNNRDIIITTNRKWH